MLLAAAEHFGLDPAMTALLTGFAVVLIRALVQSGVIKLRSDNSNDNHTAPHATPVDMGNLTIQTSLTMASLAELKTRAESSGRSLEDLADVCQHLADAQRELVAAIVALRDEENKRHRAIVSGIKAILRNGRRKA